MPLHRYKVVNAVIPWSLFISVVVIAAIDSFRSCCGLAFVREREQLQSAVCLEALFSVSV